MSSLTDGLPDALRTVRTRPLFVMHLNVRKLQIVGATPGAHRRIRVRRGLLLPGEWAAGRSPPRPPQSPPGRSQLVAYRAGPLCHCEPFTPVTRPDNKQLARRSASDGYHARVARPRMRAPGLSVSRTVPAGFGYAGGGASP